MIRSLQRVMKTKTIIHKLRVRVIDDGVRGYSTINFDGDPHIVALAIVARAVNGNDGPITQIVSHIVNLSINEFEKIANDLDYQSIKEEKGKVVKREEYLKNQRPKKH